MSLARLALTTWVGVWFPDSVPPSVSLSWTALSPVLVEVENQPFPMTLDSSYILIVPYPLPPKWLDCSQKANKQAQTPVMRLNQDPEAGSPWGFASLAFSLGS